MMGWGLTCSWQEGILGRRLNRRWLILAAPPPPRQRLGSLNKRPQQVSLFPRPVRLPTAPSQATVILPWSPYPELGLNKVKVADEEIYSTISWVGYAKVDFEILGVIIR